MTRPTELPEMGAPNYKRHLHTKVVEILDYNAEQDEKIDEVDKKLDRMEAILLGKQVPKQEPKVAPRLPDNYPSSHHQNDGVFYNQQNEKYMVIENGRTQFYTKSQWEDMEKSNLPQE